jgi:hypothetical protein
LNGSLGNLGRDPLTSVTLQTVVIDVKAMS